MNTQEAKAEDTSPIWNPNAAANWCLIFTPAFGAYLHMLNWRAMGEPQRAAASQKWFNAAIALLILYAILAVALPDSKGADGITRLIAFIFLLSWYFGSARSQAKFVKERLGATYTKRPWGKALGLALLGLLGFMVAIFVLALIAAAFR